MSAWLAIITVWATTVMGLMALSIIWHLDAGVALAGAALLVALRNNPALPR